MLTVHHLIDLRSQRSLWLLTELGIPYESKGYQRNPQTCLAPPDPAYDDYVSGCILPKDWPCCRCYTPFRPEPENPWAR